MMGEFLDLLEKNTQDIPNASWHVILTSLVGFVGCNNIKRKQWNRNTSTYLGRHCAYLVTVW